MSSQSLYPTVRRVLAVLLMSLLGTVTMVTAADWLDDSFEDEQRSESNFDRQDEDYLVDDADESKFAGFADGEDDDETTDYPASWRDKDGDGDKEKRKRHKRRRHGHRRSPVMHHHHHHHGGGHSAGRGAGPMRHGPHLLMRRLARLEHKLDLVLHELDVDDDRSPRCRGRGKGGCPYCESHRGRHGHHGRRRGHSRGDWDRPPRGERHEKPAEYSVPDRDQAEWDAPPSREQPDVDTLLDQTIAETEALYNQLDYFAEFPDVK